MLVPFLLVLYLLFLCLQISEAEGVCRIDTSSEQLAVLVWGVSGLSQSIFLMVFVYQWDTQHTQRFSLPLPSPVTPQRWGL